MLLPQLTAIQVQLICAVVLAMHCGQASAHPFDESEVTNLSGKVKRIVEDPGNGLIVTYNFGQDLRLTEASFQLAKQNQDPSWPRTMKFDYQGGLKHSALLSHPNGFALRTAYAYNDNRQCTAEVTTDNDGTFYGAILRQYDEADNLTDESEFTLQRGLIGMRHYEGGILLSEWHPGFPGRQIRKGERNEDTGRWSEVLYYDSMGSDESVDVYGWSIKLYDAQRNVTTLLSFSRKGIFVLLLQNHYEYDNVGNWVVMESQQSFPQMGGETIRFRSTREITYFDKSAD